MTSDISVSVEDEILTITLNRPDRLNAFTNVMRDEMITAFDQADADDDVRCIIVTGEGRGFCAGADLGEGGDTFNTEREGQDGPVWRDGGGQVSLRIFESKKPVIGAINGPAVGVGVTMTLPMDIRIASSAAKFGFVFSRRGIVPEACSSWFLPRIVGIQQALAWTFSGRVFPAEEALKGGLVQEVTAPENLLPRARAIAAEIVENTAPVSVALTRQMMWRMLGADHPMEAHKIDSRGIAQLGISPDVKEGVESFLEKRPPEFSMKPSEDMPDFYPWWDDRPFK
ncbi:MAG: crotonase/enoyl-CoA hydratase family protein [Paracoccaceae bacterium]|nr:crotonase/enoyl-CoA hydratase family protein [Paracoccaceae bacterium]MDG1370018.1 crotonase/enoyl-CoA hydratase family protein [Paracoccaceae bacterium]